MSAKIIYYIANIWADDYGEPHIGRLSSGPFLERKQAEQERDRLNSSSIDNYGVVEQDIQVEFYY